MAYLYPYGDTQQLNLDWLIEQWNEVKSQIDGSLQAEIDRVEDAITDLLTARDEAVAAQTAAQASAQAAAGSASTASGAASTATAQAQAAAGSAATAGAHASDAQGYAATAQQAAQAANNSARAAAVSEGNARNSETAAAGSSSAAAGNALYSEGYAKGTQNGNPVSSGSPYYENNAKYYSDQAAQDASDAANSAQDAQDAATLLQPPATSADIGKALIVKTVGGGTVTSYELGESGGGGSTPGIINTIEDVAIASFDDGLNAPVHQLIVNIDPVQSGSGDPDPDNVRLISGWNGANINISGADTSNPTTIAITFPVEAGTVYGGTLTNQGSNEWKLRVDTLFIELDGTEAGWTKYGTSTIYNTTLARNTLPATGNALKGICSYIRTNIYGNIDTYLSHVNSGNGLQFNNVPTYFGLADNEVTTWKAYLASKKASGTPVQILAYLQNPVEYTFTTAEIIQILLGDNNIWADTGNINLLQYYADSKKYIDEQDALIKALIAKELPDMTADTALVANDFRIVNNTLYRVTASVASGGTLTPGTNCAATTITDILKTLLS